MPFRRGIQCQSIAVIEPSNVKDSNRYSVAIMLHAREYKKQVQSQKPDLQRFCGINRENHLQFWGGLPHMFEAAANQYTPCLCRKHTPGRRFFKTPKQTATDSIIQYFSVFFTEIISLTDSTRSDNIIA